MPALTKNSDQVTQQTNTTGLFTSILDVTADSGTYLKLHNNVARGTDSGMPVVMDLRDGSDNQLPDDTEVVLTLERPTDTRPQPESEKVEHIGDWNSLSLTEQRNDDYIDSIKIDLKSNKVNVRDNDTLRVEVNSSAAIDWSNSTFQIVSEAVDVFTLGNL